jgi:hypothetical protein
MEGMLAELAQAIEELVIPPDGAAITEAYELRDRLDAKLAEALSAFDAASFGTWTRPRR